MSDGPSPDYRWTTIDEPDALVVQLAPVPLVTDDGPQDVMRMLLLRRGFRPVVEAARLDLGASQGCLVTRSEDGGAALLVAVGAGSGASRLALPDIDEAWWARSVALGHAAVLAVETAVDPDGATTREALRRDVDAGGVVAALVPVEDVR